MKKLLVVFGMVLFATCMSVTAFAANVAFNAAVTLDGTFFTDGWGGGVVVDKSTVVDGVFLPENTQWDQGAVWWDERGDNKNQSITIDLGGLFAIDSFIVQADDNDSYKLEYYDSGIFEWVAIPPIYSYGMVTRPEIFLPDTVTTTKLKFSATGGDGYYSVSEIQAFGKEVPEPTTILLFGVGLAGLAAYRRRRTDLK